MNGSAQGGKRWTPMVRRIVWGAGGAVVVVGVVLAVRPGAVPVDTAPVDRGALRVMVEEDGVTRVRERHGVVAPLSGTLGRVTLKAGDRVEAGEVLAQVSPLPSPLLDSRSRSEAEGRVSIARAGVERARAEVTRAEAGVALAQREVERQRVLLEGRSGTPFALAQAEAAARVREGELEAARSGVRMAEFEVETARRAVNHLAGGAQEPLGLVSPVDGVVLRVHHEGGGVVPAGTLLMEVGDPGRLEVVVDLLTADAVRVAPGAPATLERWGGDPLQAVVSRIEPSAFTRISSLGVEEQRVNVLLDIEPGDGAEAQLGDGFRVEARILVLERPDVVRAPSSAVFRLGDGWAVFVVDGGRARLRPVDLGVRTPDAVEILSGVEPGSRVVVYPGDLVVDGVRIRER
jgi:HlyD family secretion protein